MKKTFLAIFGKELKNYLFAPATYLYLVLFAGVAMYLYFQTFFLQDQADTNVWFTNLPFLLLFFIPALSMGVISEEKKRGTWEILLTLPANEIVVVAAKFLAGLTMVLFMLVTTIGLPVTLALLGSPDWGVIFSSYLGAFLLAAGYLATGFLASSLVSQQAVAFVLAFVILLVNDFLAQTFFLVRLPVFLKSVFTFISLRSHYDNFMRGLIGINDLIFFLTWIFLFLLLTIISLRSRDF